MTPDPPTFLVPRKELHIVLARYKEDLDHWMNCIPWIAQEYDITLWIVNKFYVDASQDAPFIKAIQPYLKKIEVRFL